MWIYNYWNLNLGSLCWYEPQNLSGRAFGWKWRLPNLQPDENRPIFLMPNPEIWRFTALFQENFEPIRNNESFVATQSSLQTQVPYSLPLVLSSKGDCLFWFVETPFLSIYCNCSFFAWPKPSRSFKQYIYIYISVGCACSYVMKLSHKIIFWIYAQCLVRLFRYLKSHCKSPVLMVPCANAE